MINGSFNLIFHVYSPVLNDEVDRLWPFEVILLGAFLMRIWTVNVFQLVSL